MTARDWCGRRGCGHTRGAHEHFRRGRECSELACQCPRFRRRWTRPGSWTWTALFLWSMRRELR